MFAKGFPPGFSLFDRFGGLPGFPLVAAHKNLAVLLSVLTRMLQKGLELSTFSPSFTPFSFLPSYLFIGTALVLV